MTETAEIYFELIEDHFRTARGTPLYTLSPRDCALIEAWKNANIPVEAVLRGIDTAFERWRRQPAQARTRMVNSLAYCTNAIAEEVQTMANAVPITRKNGAPPFSLDNVSAFVCNNAASLRSAGHGDLAASLEALDVDRLYSNLEQLEQHLTAIEEKVIQRLRDGASKEALFEIRRALDRDLRPYRGKMTPEQIALLEKQFVEGRLLESAGLPRLSPFYL